MDLKWLLDTLLGIGPITGIVLIFGTAVYGMIELGVSPGDGFFLIFMFGSLSLIMILLLGMEND